MAGIAALGLHDHGARDACANHLPEWVRLNTARAYAGDPPPTSFAFIAT